MEEKANTRNENCQLLDSRGWYLSPRGWNHPQYGRATRAQALRICDKEDTITQLGALAEREAWAAVEEGPCVVRTCSHVDPVTCMAAIIASIRRVKEARA